MAQLLYKLFFNASCFQSKLLLMLLSRSSLEPLISLDLVGTKLYCFRARVHCYHCLYIIFSTNPVRRSEELRGGPVNEGFFSVRLDETLNLNNKLDQSVRKKEENIRTLEKTLQANEQR